MKILIAYSSVSGTAEKCAAMLAAHFGDSATLHNLNDGQPDIDGYDMVVIGSCIRYGKISREAKAFISENKYKLNDHITGYFICCGFMESSEEYIIKNIPAELLLHSAIYLNFGGELNIKAQKSFADKMSARIIRNIVLDDGHNDGELKTANLPSVLPENISRFADAMRRAYARH